MENLWDFIEKHFTEFSIFAVSVFATTAKISIQDNRTFKERLLSNIGEFFLCWFIVWVGFEFAFYFTKAFGFSLAVGAFASVKGLKWVERYADMFFKAKICKDCEDEKNGD